MRDLVQIAENVYHNRETEEEKEQRKRKRKEEDEREMEKKEKQQERHLQRILAIVVRESREERLQPERQKPS